MINTVSPFREYLLNVAESLMIEHTAPRVLHISINYWTSRNAQRICKVCGKKASSGVDGKRIVCGAFAGRESACMLARLNFLLSRSAASRRHGNLQIEDTYFAKIAARLNRSGHR